MCENVIAAYELDTGPPARRGSTVLNRIERCYLGSSFGTYQNGCIINHSNPNHLR